MTRIILRQMVSKEGNILYLNPLLIFKHLQSYPIYIDCSISEFLGRTEIRISDLIAEKFQQDHAVGPITKKLPLYEADSGVVTVRLDLQLF